MSSNRGTMADDHNDIIDGSYFGLGHDNHGERSAEDNGGHNEVQDGIHHQEPLLVEIFDYNVDAAEPVHDEFDPDISPYHNNHVADFIDFTRQANRIGNIQDTNYMHYRPPQPDLNAQRLFYLLSCLTVVCVTSLRLGDGLWGEMSHIGTVIDAFEDTTNLGRCLLCLVTLAFLFTVRGMIAMLSRATYRDKVDANVNNHHQGQQHQDNTMNKDAVYTSVHMHNPRNADLFEDVCKDHLPADDIFVAPHHQPINPEDEDDVVPDQHAAFGIQRATQAVREPAWKDLGLAQLMHSRGRDDRTAKGDKAGSYGYYAYYYGYNPNGIAGSVAAAGAASASDGANAANVAPNAHNNGSPPPAPVRTQRFRGMPR